MKDYFPVFSTEDLAMALRARREEMGISIRDLAKQIGVSENSLHDWEKNKSAPTLRNAIKWCDLLDYDLVPMRRGE